MKDEQPPTSGHDPIQTGYFLDRTLRYLTYYPVYGESVEAMNVPGEQSSRLLEMVE